MVPGFGSHGSRGYRLSRFTARTAALAGPALAEFLFGGFQVGQILGVPVALDLPPHVRKQESRTTARNERWIRSAEQDGNREQALEWEARLAAFRRDRHARRVAMEELPVKLLKELPKVAPGWPRCWPGSASCSPSRPCISATYTAGRWRFVPSDLSSYGHGRVRKDIAATKAAGYCGKS